MSDWPRALSGGSTRERSPLRLKLCKEPPLSCSCTSSVPKLRSASTQLIYPAFFTVSERLKIRHTAYDKTMVATNVIAAVVPESFVDRDIAAAME